ncbi:MAG: hypothetical protein ACK5TH_18670 [Prosthecobacter sp.]|jgi:hypothetical protein
MILGWIFGGDGFFQMDLGFVGIPIGAGLLSASEAARKWAIFLAGLCLATGAWLAVEWLRSTQGVVYRPEMTVWALLMLGAAFVLGVLCSRRNREWFSARLEPIGGIRARSFVWTTCIVTSVLAILHFVTWMRLEAAFGVNCRLVPIDSKTNKQLKSIRWSCDQLSQPGGRQLGRLSFATSGDPSGVSLILDGVAFTPLTFRLHADGYQDGHVELVPRLQGDVQVMLEPIAAP